MSSSVVHIALDLSERISEKLSALQVNTSKNVIGQSSSTVSIPSSCTDEEQVQEQEQEEVLRDASHARAHRFREIFAHPLHMDPDFVAPFHPKSKEQHEFIESSLRDNFIFTGLNGVERKTLIDAMELHQVDSGVTVIYQGDIGDYFYVINSGIVKFTVDGQFVGSAERGGIFGELALLYNCQRAATCIADTPCELWRVEQDSFRRILASHSIQNDRETRYLLRKVPFLAELDDRTINRISSAFVAKPFQRGEILGRKGDTFTNFCILKEGNVKVTDVTIGESKYPDAIFGPGAYFGVRPLLKNALVEGNATAVSDGTMLYMSGEDFKEIFGNMNDLIFRSSRKRQLMMIPLFRNSYLEPYEFDTLASAIDEVSRPKGFILAREGKHVDPAIYFVRSGEVSVTSISGENSVLKDGGYFGDDTLIPGVASQDIVAKHTATVLKDCRLGVLTLKAIKSAVDVSLLSEPKDSSVATKLDSSINFSDLEFCRLLGEGTFGRVWLVTQRSTGDTYALKVQGKKQLLKRNQVNGVLREKSIMAAIDSPFITKLVNVYQDLCSLYMLLNLVQGCELFALIHTKARDGLPESWANFYAASILQGLSYMHRRCILHRDLKPENVMVDSGGYALIVDLGFAKIAHDKTYTLCGTPLFLAPEVILCRGHDKGADHWSFGILIYEMIAGVTPFLGWNEDIDQMTMFKRVVHGDFSLPSDVMSNDAKDLIKRLLVTDPGRRLGSFASGDKDICDHLWFRDIDFAKLTKKESEAPWIPKIREVLDHSSYSPSDFPDDDNAVCLTPKEQAIFEGFSEYV